VGTYSHASKYKSGYINLSTEIYKISTKTDNISTKLQTDLKNLNILAFTFQILEKEYNFKFK
jgi:hypothetical protein